MIPQIEPYIHEDDVQAVTEYMESGGWITEFIQTQKFEQELADYLDVEHAIVCTSGTVALYLLLKAHRIEGQQILVPNYTMVATINAAIWSGANPVIVDTDPVTMCMDLSLIHKAIDRDSNIKNLIYVSINGRSDPNLEHNIEELQRSGITVFEDACQSFGSMTRLGNKLGTVGHAGVFSFTPHKAITTGQGGLIVTNDDSLAQSIRKLKDFGRIEPGKDEHDQLGYNFKFTDLQASLGRSQLRRIRGTLERKRELYNLYLADIIGDEMDFVGTINMYSLHPYEYPWFVEITLPNKDYRDRLQTYLKGKGIQSRPIYPPINHQPIFRSYKRHTFPTSEDLALRGLWLPSSVTLKNYQVHDICKYINQFVKENHT